MADTTSDGPRLTLVGKLLVLLVVAGSLYGAWWLFVQGRTPPAPGGTPERAADVERPGAAVEIGISYGTEKKRWLETAVEAFARTRRGASIKIDLIPRGSVEGAQEIVRGDDAAHRVQVWTPASSLYKDAFVQDWQVKYGNNPIAKEERLALSPMVFVFWEERWQAFVQRYGTVSFQTIAQAIREKSGWDTIAQHPEWGLFKFSHTHPNKSNSGLMTLVLMAYDFHGKSRDLSLKDVLNPDFQARLTDIERAVTGMGDSTGTMMREMVLKGPSSYDAVFTYENVAIDYLRNAEGRWGKLHVEYPKYNAWNDNPYYILDAPWSSREQRAAAEAFLDFLMSEPVQKESLTHGFRPGNPSVPVRFPESPFVLYQPFGLKVDLTTMCDPPSADVVNNLLIAWQRSQGGR